MDWVIWGGPDYRGSGVWCGLREHGCRRMLHSMSSESRNLEKARAYVRLLQNPYASLSLELHPDDLEAREATAEQKSTYLRNLQNPYAFFAIFDDPDEAPNKGFAPVATLIPVSNERAISRVDLERTLDEVLRLYRPYVARSEWAKVSAYREEFLQEATRMQDTTARVYQRLRGLIFAVGPGEKVEYNRAPAERMIGELKRLLG